MNPKRKSTGFTLLELMTTLTIGAIILSVGVPSFRSVLKNSEMTTSTNDMVMSLNLARSEAIKRVSYVTLCASKDGFNCNAGDDWSEGWVLFSNTTPGSPGSVDFGDEIIRAFPGLSDDLEVTPTGAVDGFISFRPTGTIGTSAANQSGTLTLCDDRGAGYARGILLDPAGQWQVSKDKAYDGTALVCP